MAARKNLKKPQDPNEELRRWEERFESLIELSSEWYWEQDKDCRFTLVTGSAAGHGGLDTKKFLGTYRGDRGAVPGAIAASPRTSLTPGARRNCKVWNTR